MTHDDRTRGSATQRTASSSQQLGSLLLERQASITLPEAMRETAILQFLARVA